MVHTWQKWYLLNVKVACGRSLKRWSSAVRTFSVVATVDRLNLYSTCSLRTAIELCQIRKKRGETRAYFMQTSA